MKKIFLLITTLIIVTNHSMAQKSNTNISKTDKTTTMEKKTLSKEVVKKFFNAFGNGDLDGIINTFHEDVTIIAVKSR